MITKAQLHELMANGENSGVEFKRDAVKPQDLAKELVAFANTYGGVVLLGVADDGTPVGLTRNRLEEWVVSICRDKIRPPIVPFFDTVSDVDEGLDVAIVRVVAGLDVHAVWHHNRNDYYVRVGSQSREPGRDGLRRLFQQRSLLRAEEQPVSGATFADLDWRRLREYFGRVRGQVLPPDSEQETWRTILTSAGFMRNDDITVAGMLLFGRKPTRFVPQASITANALPGDEKDYAARERGTIRGPMTPLRDQNGELVENGVVEQAVAFVTRNTRANAYLEPGGRRVDRPDYPQAVVREAVVNALIHRDYLLTGTDIELTTYRQRIEIVTPGRLHNGVTPETMRIGTRTARNLVLKDVMRDYGYLERMGMGVPRKIIHGMKEHNGTDVDLIVEENRFTVRLRATDWNPEDHA